MSVSGWFGKSRNKEEEEDYETDGINETNEKKINGSMFVVIFM